MKSNTSIWLGRYGVVTSELTTTYDGLPETVKSAILALSILVDRIGSLPERDRDDLFDLLVAWRDATDSEEQLSIRKAMEEVLAQTPIIVDALPFTEWRVLSGGAERWVKHVGKRIRLFRGLADLSQAQLAWRAGLTQSHISRLENAEHIATTITMEKIARALGISVDDLSNPETGWSE
jgi:DNA-binding XRE family transcriptional regulator